MLWPMPHQLEQEAWGKQRKVWDQKTQLPCWKTRGRDFITHRGRGQAPGAHLLTALLWLLPLFCTIMRIYFAGKVRYKMVAHGTEG